MVTNDNKDVYSSRAGIYASQIGGYKAFVPRPLPPDPSIKIDNEMMHLLSMAERALGRLDGTSAILPNVDLFVAMYVNKEAVLSSQIEGTQASLIDVLAFEADAAFPENPQDVEEVINYVDALNYGLDSTSSAYRLLEYLYRRPIITVSGITQVVNLNYANTNRLVTRFQELGILRQMDTHQRNRRFAYVDYLALFADEEIRRNEAEAAPGSQGDETSF